MTKQQYDKERQSIFANGNLSVKDRIKQLKLLAEKRKQEADKIGRIGLAKK